MPSSKAIRKVAAPAILLLLLVILPIGDFAQAGDVEKPMAASEVVAALRGEFQRAIQHYRQGQTRRARMIMSDAYFDLFEGEGMEAAVGLKSVSMKVEIESIFGQVNSTMGRGAPLEKIESKLADLEVRLGEAASMLEEAGSPLSLFISSLVIILREGVEAILIISALVAYLTKMGNRDKVRNVYGGAIAALAASVFTALAVKAFFASNPAGQEVLEGLTMLSARLIRNRLPERLPYR